MRCHPVGILILLGLISLTGRPAVQARDFNDAEIAHISYPGWFKDSFLDQRQDLKEARASSG